MGMILFSVAALAVGFVVHAVVWRVRLPRQRVAALLAIFGAVFLAALGLSLVPAVTAPAQVTWLDRFHFAVFYVPLALTYTSFHSLIEHDSPSLRVVRMLHEAGAAGCSREQVARLFPANVLEERLRSAIGNGLVGQVGTDWQLTRAGARLARVSEFAARVVGAGEGG